MVLEAHDLANHLQQVYTVALQVLPINRGLAIAVFNFKNKRWFLEAEMCSPQLTQVLPIHHTNVDRNEVGKDLQIFNTFWELLKKEAIVKEKK